MNLKVVRQNVTDQMNIAEWQKAIKNYKRQVAKAISDISADLVNKSIHNSEEKTNRLKLELDRLKSINERFEKLELDLDRIITDEQLENISNFNNELENILNNDFNKFNEGN